MATIKLYNNVFENEYKEFSYDESKSLCENIESHVDEDVYKETLVECYDSETGKTFYAPIEEEKGSTLILVNQKSVDKDYVPKKTDIIEVFYLPLSSDTRSGVAAIGLVIGAVIGAVAVGVLTVATGGAALLGISTAAAFLLGAGAGAIVGGVVGALTGAAIWDKYHQQIGENRGGKNGKTLPDIRDAENESLRGSNFPFVMGKHLVTPRIVGDPVTEYSGKLGKDAYVKMLLCVGYGPVKLTDFKLGDFMLAYNRSHGDVEKRTMLHGLLKGYSTGGETPVEGDIDDYWKNNDVSLELIQYKGSGNAPSSFLYPNAVDIQELNANTFYIADKELDENVQVVYKGIAFPNTFRTNGVFFSASCPQKVTINFDLPQGLYASYSETSNNITQQKYEKISCYYCIQWRPYNINNKPSDPNGYDFDEWHNISVRFPEGGSSEPPLYFDRELNFYTALVDANNHKGNDFGEQSFSNIYKGFYNKTLANFGRMWDHFSEDDLISEIRLSATIDFTKQECLALLSDTNPMKSIEIRVLRVSPNYLNQTSSNSDSVGPYSYSDLVKVSSIITESFDEEELRVNDRLVNVKPQSDADYKKFSYIAIKAKADSAGYLINQFKKLNCIAESFSPIWDSEQKKILPEGITKQSLYYGYYSASPYTDANRCNRSNADGVTEVAVTKAEYEKARRDGFNWVEDKQGSNFTSIMRSICFTIPITHNEKATYYLPHAAEKYNDNSVVSSFLLACMGAQNGPESTGLEGINILSIADWAENTDALTDGSTFNAVTTYRGVTYQKGDLVPVHYEANAYIYSGIKLDELLSKIAAAGRAFWVIDETGKIKVIMDRPADYTKGVISAQNCLSSNNQFSYEDLPAGLFISFSDENDGYEQNSIYCWNDGFSIKNYHGQVEPCAIDFVTNPYQLHSLGRYLLACRTLQKEVLQRKIGIEGTLYELGDVVLVQDDELLIGDVSGRIQEIIEENGVIYGFVTDTPYEYKAEEGESGESTQGITALQPGYMGKSNAVTLPIAMPSSRTIHVSSPSMVGTIERTFTLAKGITNVVLFATPVTRSTSEDPSTTTTIKYNFKTGDICLFGLINKISAPYRIIKIKPEKDGTFTETMIPYDEKIYNYGAELPSFQNYITPPAVETYPVSLSEVPTTLKEMNDSRSDIYGKIDTLQQIVSDLHEYTAQLSMSAIGSAVRVVVYRDGELATGTLYYADFYGTGTDEANQTGATGTITDGTTNISAVANANKHIVKIYSDSTRFDLLATAFVSYGDTGSGSDSTSYWMIEDATSIKCNSSGVFTPAKINVYGKKQTGTSAPTSYTGRIKIEYSTNGSTYETVVNSDVASYEYTIPSGTKSIKVSLYVAGDTTVLLDQDIIPVVNDGTDGGYQDYQFAVGDFGLTDEQARALDWYDAPPTVPDGKCLYMATKFIGA